MQELWLSTRNEFSTMSKKERMDFIGLNNKSYKLKNENKLNNNIDTINCQFYIILRFFIQSAFRHTLNY